jgi:hypothetical protein
MLFVRKEKFKKTNIILKEIFSKILLLIPSRDIR